MSKHIVAISVDINAPISLVWKTWTSPKDIIQWNTASPEWCTTNAENDLRAGGRFSSRMEAKDGSMGFDFGGTYNEIIENKLITYTLDDDRNVEVVFEFTGDKTIVTETFEAESTNPIEIQKSGWQAILDNFKNYTEELK